jgi:hypothetical protein
MKRDMELIRRMMLAIEESARGYAPYPMPIEGYLAFSRTSVRSFPLEGILDRGSNCGASNRGAHRSRTHLQTAVERYMSCQVRARLILRTKLLRCRRTEARQL